jgi:hypothetical protein
VRTIIDNNKLKRKEEKATKLELVVSAQILYNYKYYKYFTNVSAKCF